jgi:hypothetical protein
MDSRDRTYASFEELERDEFRRMETLGASVDEMIEAIFGEEVRLQPAGSYDGDEDEDDGDLDRAG